MNDDEKFALVPKSPSGLKKVEPVAKTVLSGMVQDTLDLAAKRRRVGNVDFCEPDYLQLMAWAEQLKLPPDEVLRRLKDGIRCEGYETRIENGKFIKLNWDAGILPATEFTISFPLKITDLSFVPIHGIAEDAWEPGSPSSVDDLEWPSDHDWNNRVKHISTVALPQLKSLQCAGIGLENLSIEKAHSVEYLVCAIENLNLALFPSLKVLIFTDYVRAVENLDLRGVPNLTALDCQLNVIKTLDLSLVPKLRKLNCSDNAMKELVLPNLQNLIELDCENSGWDKDSGLGQWLEVLDLRGAPNLEGINCGSNMLENLDLSSVPKLKRLDCSSNSLSALDLSCVPNLEILECRGYSAGHFINWNPPFIKELDIRPLLHLKKISCDSRTRIMQRPDQQFTAGDK